MTVQHDHKQRLGDLSEDMFTQREKEDEPEPAEKKCKVSTNTPILTEIKQICDSRIPMRACSKNGFFLKKAQPSGFLGVLLGVFQQAGKIGKIIQKLSNFKP